MCSAVAGPGRGFVVDTDCLSGGARGPVGEEGAAREDVVVQYLCACSLGESVSVRRRPPFPARPPPPPSPFGSASPLPSFPPRTPPRSGVEAGSEAGGKGLARRSRLAVRARAVGSRASGPGGEFAGGSRRVEGQGQARRQGGARARA